MNDQMMTILGITTNNNMSSEDKSLRRKLRKKAIERGAHWYEIRDLTCAALVDYVPGSNKNWSFPVREPGYRIVPEPFSVKLQPNQGFAHIRGECTIGKKHQTFDFAQTTVTVAWEDLGTSVRFGFAFCAPGDNFCRREGRRLAWERLNDSNQSWTIPSSAMQDVSHPADLARTFLGTCTLALPSRWMAFDPNPYLKNV